ncbi:MAG: sortase, partial [Promicromonosporaceae bacterium]|nr:sortase [Promicromonosporaceae bacterium]
MSNTSYAIPSGRSNLPPKHAAPARRIVPRRRRSVGSAIAGVIGELLITAGVLVGLFVVWQWFWTDVVALREQAEILQALPWEPPPPVAAPPAAEERAVEPPVDPQPAFGEVFGQMYIPRFGPDWVGPLAGGVDRRQIIDRIGVGHFPLSAMPGQLGNFATAAHRVSFGRLFHGVENLEVGDPI